MGLAALLLLVTCTNVGSLLLARVGSRQREIAVRQALGCGSARLVRQFFAESLLLSTAGGIAGLTIAPWNSQALLAIAAFGTPVFLDTSIDMNLMLFGAAVSLTSAVTFGLAPAWSASRPALEPALRASSRSSTGTHSRRRLNRWLVTVQVALSVVLVVGSVLFSSSLYHLYTTDVGFDREGVISIAVNPRVAGYQSAEQYSDLAQRLTARIAALPGVRSVSVAGCGMLGGCSREATAYSVEDRKYGQGDPILHFNEVSGNFLQTLGLPFIAGRGFSPGDKRGAPQVAVVNKAFADVYLRGQSGVGKHFGLGMAGRENIEIVGIVGNSRYNDVRQPTGPLAFLPFEQFSATFNHVQLKIDGPPEPVMRALRPAILEVEPKLRVLSLETLERALDRTLARDILLARLSGLFGALALALACFGVYGLISYWVVSRTTEIGIRLAIGARPAEVIFEVIGDAVKTVCPGAVGGIVVALVAERWILPLLFGVRARDPWTYGSVAACLVLTTVLAAYVPARRASRIDPAIALRCD